MRRLIGGKSTGIFCVESVRVGKAVVAVYAGRNVQSDPDSGRTVRGAENRNERFGELSMKAGTENTV